MFENDPPVSVVERAVAAVAGRMDAGPLSVADVLHPGLLSGREWAHEPTAPRHAAASGAGELDRLLAAGAEPLARAAAASREIARLSAVVATSLAELARCRPASLFDRQPGERGAMSAATRAARPAALTEVSEWAVDEVAPTLRISGTAANVQLEESVVLVERLPRTHTMLADGALSPAHVRQLVAIVGPVADDALRADIEAHVLGLLEDKTPPQLGTVPGGSCCAGPACHRCLASRRRRVRAADRPRAG